MLTQFATSSKVPTQNIQKPTLVLLSGTSSSGKSTTATYLKLQLDAQNGSDTLVLSYDAFCQKHHDAFMAHLDRCIEKAGFKGGLEENIKNKFTLSESEIEKLEACVEENGTPWMQQRLADEASAALKAGKSVIIDTLDTHDILKRLSISLDSMTACNALLTVPFLAFPGRVKSRNTEALKQYQQDISTKAYENCRESFDMLEQYTQFYHFKPVKEAEGLSRKEIHAALEAAYEDSIQLYSEMADIHFKHSNRFSEGPDKDTSKSDALKSKADSLRMEVEALKNKRQQTVKKVFEMLIGDESASTFNMQPKKEYDLVMNTTIMTPKAVAELILTTFDAQPTPLKKARVK